MRPHADAASGGILLLAAGVYGAATRGFPAGEGEPGPAFFPLILSGALVIVAFVILVQGLRAGLARYGTDTVPRPHGISKPLGVIALTAAYITSFEPLGFVASTAVYTLLITMTFRRQRPLVMITTPILSTLFIYLLFDVGLGVPLPRGLLE